MRDHMIPKLNGSKGTTIKETVFLRNIYPLLSYFMPENRTCYIVKSNHKNWPFTGGKFLQLVWQINELEHLKDNLLSIFENLTVPSEALWIHKRFDQSSFIRFDEPKENEEIRCFYETSNKAHEERLAFLERNFGSTSYRTKSINLVVGKVPNGKKRVAPFKITFTRNWEISEDKFVGGVLQFRFFHEVRDGGALKGEFVDYDNDEDGDEVVEEVLFDELLLQKENNFN